MSGSFLTEPTTLLTDYLLTAECLYFFVLLRRSNRDHQVSRRLWAWALLLSAIAAFAGGSMHGFRGVLPEAAAVALWKTTQFSAGFIALCFSLGTAKAVLPPRWHRPAAWLFGTKLAVYGAWMLGHDEFIFVIADYGSAMLVVLLLQGWAWWRRPTGNEKYFILGVSISILAAGVQASGFSLHEHFNYNDLYHVIQMVGIYFFYRGARGLTDRVDAGPPASTRSEFRRP